MYMYIHVCTKNGCVQVINVFIVEAVRYINYLEGEASPHKIGLRNHIKQSQRLKVSKGVCPQTRPLD